MTNDQKLIHEIMETPTHINVIIKHEMHTYYVSIEDHKEKNGPEWVHFFQQIVLKVIKFRRDRKLKAICKIYLSDYITNAPFAQGKENQVRAAALALIGQFDSFTKVYMKRRWWHSFFA